MDILENVSLKELTTFRIGGTARFFCRAKSIDDAKRAIAYAHERSLPLFILGGGSNILMSDDGFPGLVVKIEITGVEFNDQGEHVEVVAGAGESWDELAAMTVSRGLHGLENLSLIPGTVGAAPVQNIGAYGAEVKDVISFVETIDRVSGEVRVFTNDECHFAYRDSIFKHEEGKRFTITRVGFRLAKNAPLKTEYKDVKEYFSSRKIETPTLVHVREAVVTIRSTKLPDTKDVGTAGSFFKNPVISKTMFDDLRKRFPELPGHDSGDGKVKVPLGFILDKICNFKTVREGDAGVWKNQALVVVNFGNASAKEIRALSEKMVASVREQTGIEIEPEVQFVS
jgi:UDP-N-acetylmuramate dehydrogenase